MTNSTVDFQLRLNALSQPVFQRSLPNIKHGVEREALRVKPSGGLADTGHPTALGAPLSHESITTDFSEALLEFITPPETSIRTSIAQLADIHKFVQDNIGDEYLWPLSMPCFVSKETNIPIARYGSSNIAQMKEVYRKGLHNRYGSMMQVIAGVHFNFSLSDDFWRAWCELHSTDANKTTISNYYFDLIRNFKRLAWIIPYLYGASPALCQSFLGGKKHKYDFKKLGKGTLYLPYATSLRMSDMGYTSAEQASLNICYNDLSSYVKTVRAAINKASVQYAGFPAGENGDWQQLNTNVLQIENELYSPIRPKQVAKSLEKPSDALENRGVSYIEVRALDVNPFSSIGIKAQQFYFLDTFLLYCLMQPSEKFGADEYPEADKNLTSVVLEGRKPGLTLQDGGADRTLKDWANAIFDDLAKIALHLDTANSTDCYSKSVSLELKKIDDANNTPSAMWLNQLIDINADNGEVGLKTAFAYKEHALDFDYIHFNQATFKQQAEDSVQSLRKIEANDKVDFGTFVTQYFADKKNA